MEVGLKIEFRTKNKQGNRLGAHTTLMILTKFTKHFFQTEIVPTLAKMDGKSKRNAKNY